MKKKITLCILSMLISLCAFAQVQPAQGNGTKSSPYIVTNAEELWWTCNKAQNNGYTATYVELANDIDMSSVCHPIDIEKGYTEEKSWYGYYFTGVFEGHAHCIKNLYSKKSGLFSIINPHSEINNVRFENVYIDCDYASGLVKYLGAYVRIFNCHVEGTIVGSEGAGGIAARMDNFGTGTLIKTCTNRANITARSFAGGILGKGSEQQIWSCKNYGTITSNASAIADGGYFGGIAGNPGYDSQMWGCINKGFINVPISKYAGGITAYRGNVYNCLNEGMVIGKTFVGGIGYDMGTCKGNLNLGDVYVANDGGMSGLIGKASGIVANTNFTSSECSFVNNGVAQANVLGGTFPISCIATPDQLESGEITYRLQDCEEDNLYWKQKIGVDKVPVVNMGWTNKADMVVMQETLNCKRESISTVYTNGSSYQAAVTLPHEMVDGMCSICGRLATPEIKDGYYQITNLNELKWLRDCVNNDPTSMQTQNARLMNDIDMSSVNSWWPIGKSSSIYFGTFDGNGHVIRNLHFDNIISNDIHGGGLFGNLLNATIKDLTIEDARTSCRGGGLLAYAATSSNILSCHVSGQIKGTENIGGLVGTSSKTNYSQCVVDAALIGDNNLGGLIGNAQNNNTIEYCSSRCDITYTSNVGDNLFGNNPTGTNVISSVFSILTHKEGEEDGDKSGYIGNDGVLHSYNRADVESGKMASYMNDSKWGQDLSIHNFPVLGGPQVFEHFLLNCKDELLTDGFPLYYTNNDDEERRLNEDGHFYEDYVCYFCGNLTTHEDGYYHIACIENLEWFRDKVNSGNLKDVKAILDCNIDLSEKYNKNATWVPIGYTKETPFTGEFEGNFHFIRHMFINTDMSQADYWGLFGYVGVPTGTSNTVIRNLILEDAVIKSNKEYTGFIAGYMREATIQDCRVQGEKDFSTIETDKDYAGGIVGYLYSGTISNSTITETNIQSTAKHVGAIAGFQNGGTISKCSVFRNQLSTTSNNIGGIVGSARQSTIQDCRIWNTEIEGASYVGGLCGYLYYATLERSYCQAEVKAKASTYNHAVVGQVLTSNTNKLYYSTTHTSLTDTKAEGLTDQMFECGKVAYLLGEPWGQNLEKGEKRPISGGPAVYYFDHTSEGGCMCYTNDPEGGESSHSYANGYCAFCGAEQTLVRDGDGIYYISNAAHLKQFRDIVNQGEWDANAKLVNDIDISPLCSSTVGSWEPIGTTNWSYGYEGTFDGDGYSITGLYINSHDYYTGLFGVARNGSNYHGATIKNLTVEGDVASSQGYCAIIAGMTQGGTITNCVARGKVSTSNGYTIAGICANAWESTIADCTNEASISATITSYNVGGIVGESTSDITGCTNTGNISIPGKAKQVGGIVGSTTANIARCINKGTINNPDQESEKTGGIVGETSGSITHCANEGDVTAHILVGGIAGRAENCSELSHNYNVGKVTANSNSVVGSLFGSAFGSSNIINNVYLSNGTFDTHGVPATEDEFHWGKVAYLLGGDWGQDISYDQKYPSLDGKKVYEHSKNLPDWKSGNKGKQGTRSEYEWEIDVDKYAFVCIDFDWTVNCDPNNYLWIHAGDEDNLVQGVSGKRNGHETYSQMESDIFHFSAIYKENYVNDDYEDEATVTNMQVKWYSNNEDKFTILSGLAGDIDGDGKLTIRDIALMIAIMNGNSSVQVGNPDIDGDGNVTMNDLELLKQSVIAIGE